MVFKKDYVYISVVVIMINFCHGTCYNLVMQMCKQNILQLIPGKTLANPQGAKLVKCLVTSRLPRSIINTVRVRDGEIEASTTQNCLSSLCNVLSFSKSCMNGSEI